MKHRKFASHRVGAKARSTMDTATVNQDAKWTDSTWTECKNELPPQNHVVETVVADENGYRNQTHLRRSGSLWFSPNSEMYVYYTPTHWRKLK